MSEEASTEDLREDAEHDADRLLYSDGIRRLGEVTQVVAVGENSLFHTRLTHTLKVAQIARRIAQHWVRDRSNEAAISALGGLDPEVAYAAGLAHDFGHPPFGHVGEAALNRKCQAAGLDGYEGNAQTLRLIAKLLRGGDPTTPGLDLSAETLNAVLKYPWLREGAHSAAKKWNAYLTERSDFERARSGFEGERQSLAAAVMDWADDVTYAVHDLEDFIRAGRIPLARLVVGGDELSDFMLAASEQLSGKPWFDRRHAARVFTGILQGFLAGSAYYRGDLSDRAALQRMSGQLIDRFVSAARVGHESEPLRVPPGIRLEVEMLKQLTWYYVIHDPGLATMQEGQERVLEELFDALMEWIPKAEAGARYRLPTGLRELRAFALEEEGVRAYPSETAQRARAVADYVSSLTERQVEDLHSRLTGRPGQSVLDPWMSY
ncbi:MAG: deoxyguanosinetriphosphate triphosphohydrolase family protein [Blastococcus sp.]